MGSQIADSLTAQFSHATDDQVSLFVTTWVFAGVIMITSLTTGLSGMNVFIEDKTTQRFNDFLVSPISRLQLTFGYLISAFTISVIMTVIIAAVGQGVLAANGGALGGEQLLSVLGYVVLSCAVFSTMSALVATFIKSSGSFTAVATITGTALGFLAGAYIPVGSLPSGVANVINALPFAQSAMLLRQPFTKDSLDQVTSGNAEAITELQTYFGIHGSVGDVDLSNGVMIAVMGIIGVVCVGLGAWRIGRSIR